MATLPCTSTDSAGSSPAATFSRSPTPMAVESPATTTRSGSSGVGTRSGGTVVVVADGGSADSGGNSKSASACCSPSWSAAQS